MKRLALAATLLLMSIAAGGCDSAPNANAVSNTDTGAMNARPTVGVKMTYRCTAADIAPECKK
jgi:hypothetical protein